MGLASTHKDVAASFLMKGGLMVASFAQSVLLARWMTAEQFGLFAIALSLAIGLGTIAAAGQQTTILRFLPVYRYEKQRGLARGIIRFGHRAVLAGALVMALLYVGVLCATLHFFPSQWRALLWVAPLLVAWSFSEFGMGLLRASGSVVWSTLPRDLMWRMLLIVGCYLLLAGGQPLTAEVTLMLGWAILSTLVAGQLLLALRMNRGNRHHDVQSSNQWTSASLGIWIATSISALGGQVETPLAGVFLGSASAGEFYVLHRIASTLTLVLVSMNVFFGARFSELFNSGRIGAAQALTSQVSIISTIAASALFAAILFLSPLVLSVFGADYLHLAPELRILAFAFFVDALCGPVGVILLVSGHAHLQSIAIAAGLALRVLTFTLGAAYGGLLGAVLASASARVAINILLLMMIHKRTGVYASVLVAPRRQISLLFKHEEKSRGTVRE